MENSQISPTDIEDRYNMLKANTWTYAPKALNLNWVSQ